MQRLLDAHAVEKVEVRPILGRPDSLLELVFAQCLRRGLLGQQRVDLIGRQQVGRHGVAEALAEQQPIERFALDQVDVLAPVHDLAGDVPAPDCVQQRLEPRLAGAQGELEADQVGLGVQRGRVLRVFGVVGQLGEARAAQLVGVGLVDQIGQFYAA